ncbi:MAG TPA: hypothetical protein VHX86_06340 [Tepidisphaeraceae bacterium]|nr:hypothetical protein [Tepidisphaeraceae bacterium]
MFKGFNLEGFDEGFIKPKYRAELIERGTTVTAANQADVQRTLATIATNKAVLDGAKIQESWFPQVTADVFLSHSHSNEDLILMLAGWLDDRFGLKSFVDSAIWGYAGTLLRTIDDKYCWQRESETYNYQLRNKSTSHVHMMLTTALGMMIHKTECLLFVNTPEAIATSEVVAGPQTYSPWIYAELTMAGIVEEVEPDRLNEKLMKFAAKGMITENDEWDGVLYTIRHLDRLQRITRQTLHDWGNKCEVRGEEALDVFYEIAAE